MNGTPVKANYLVLFLVMLGGLATVCNPFAPSLSEGDPFGDLLGDPMTIEGFFTNFRNAYELRDLSLFQNAALIQLQWNQIISRDELEADLQTRVVRSFNLTIALEGGEVFRGDGNVNFLLVRPDTSNIWKLRFWRDESEF